VIQLAHEKVMWRGVVNAVATSKSNYAFPSGSQNQGPSISAVRDWMCLKSRGYRKDLLSVEEDVLWTIAGPNLRIHMVSQPTTTSFLPHWNHHISNSILNFTPKSCGNPYYTFRLKIDNHNNIIVAHLKYWTVHRPLDARPYDRFFWPSEFPRSSAGN
jgi:hypothetical protein